ncbi:hypothetical protein PMAYCL1PPCAC_06481, partial [Pristionchus mayeri]
MTNLNDIGSASDLYLGAIASHKAERETRKRSTFKLYHKMPRSSTLEKMDSILQLIVCYRTSRGNYRSLPLPLPLIFDLSHLFEVEHNGDVEAPMLFDSIERLTRYYQAYPLIEVKPDGEACIELFPI